MGGVDTIGVLPTGSPDDVRRATARLIEGMTADGGGYILAASHTVPPETPDENIFAMYEIAGLALAKAFNRAAEIRRQVTQLPVPFLRRKGERKMAYPLPLGPAAARRLVPRTG